MNHVPVLTRSKICSASCRLTPCTFARSSIDACRTPCSPPKAFSNSRRRLGPRPGISSSSDSRRSPVPRLPVAGDREAVCFVANSLDQPQRGRVGGEYKRHLPAGKENALLPHPAVRSLGDADHVHVRHPERCERFHRGRELPRAAVDQQQVGNRRLAAQDARKAPLDRLLDAGVIVAGSESAQVEAPIVALDRAVGPEHHARGDRRFTHRVADVEALQTLRRARQFQIATHRLELVRDRGATRGAHLQPERRIVARHLDPARARSADVAAHAHGVTGLFLQRGLEQVGLLDGPAQQNLGRRLPRKVVLRQEARQHLGFAAETALREEIGAAEVAAAAHEHDRDAVLAAQCRDGDGVDVLPADAADRLARLDLLQHGDLVAQSCRLLERQPRRRSLHAPREVVDHLRVAAFEHLARIRHVPPIVGRGDETHARRRAALDLVLQAGSRAVAEKRVLAGTQPEQLLQQQQRLARRDAVRVRPEEPARHLLRAAVVRDARELVAGDVDVRKALVVLQQHVVVRLVALDQVVLEQQRLGLGRRDRHLDRARPARAAPASGRRARGRGNSSRRDSSGAAPCRRRGSRRPPRACGRRPAWRAATRGRCAGRTRVGHEVQV